MFRDFSLWEVWSDVRYQVDGPMLRHGLQEMAGVSLLKPRTRAAQAKPAGRLGQRYEQFYSRPRSPESAVHHPRSSGHRVNHVFETWKTGAGTDESPGVLRE